MLKIKFCGAAGGDVTGSKHLISSSKQSILLDCGLFQGRRKQSIFRNKNFSFDPHKLNAVIISHAHIDHTGALPLLVRECFNSDIYMTHITEELLKIMLVDSARLQQEDAEFYNKINKEDQITPLYNEEDVLKTFNLFRSVKRNREFSIADDFKIKFINAAHVLGSSCVLIYSEGKSILYSGDVGRQKQFILRSPNFEEKVDWLIIESTYGNRRHLDSSGAVEFFKDLIRKIVRRKSKLIIPSFSLERTQEIINIFDRIRHDEDIPAIPIYVDSPMSVKITDIFNKYINEEDYSDEFKKYAESDKDPFGYDYIFYISSKEESKKLNSMNGPVVIISASGMCEGGRVLHHIRNSIDNPNNILLLVGYQAENTCGRRLKDGAKKIRIFGFEHDVRFEVCSLDFFSSHADMDDLIYYVKRINPQKGIFLVHGENEARESFKKTLLENGFKNIFLPQLDEEFEI